MSLKGGNYISMKKRMQRDGLLVVGICFLLSFHYLYLFPTYEKTKIELYTTQAMIDLIKNHKTLKPLFNGELNIEDVKQKIDLVKKNTLVSSDPFNSIYVSNYINSVLNKYGTQFQFGEQNVFTNVGYNNVKIELYVNSAQDVSDILTIFSKDGYLNGNTTFEKSGQIYKINLNLRFVVNNL